MTSSLVIWNDHFIHLINYLKGAEPTLEALTIGGEKRQGKFSCYYMNRYLLLYEWKPHAMCSQKFQTRAIV
jgi:hypothetical protein